MAHVTEIDVKDASGTSRQVATLDAVLAIVATAALQDAANSKLDQLHGDLAPLGGFLDGLETLVGSTNSGNASILAKLSGDPATQTTLAEILAKLIAAPATEAKQDALLTAIGKIGTRAYGTVTRAAVGAASALSAVIDATEVLLHPSTKCFVLAVAGTGTPMVAADTGIPLEAGEKFHMRITSGQRIAVIRDTADGFLHIAPVL